MKSTRKKTLLSLQSFTIWTMGWFSPWNLPSWLLPHFPTAALGLSTTREKTWVSFNQRFWPHILIFKCFRHYPCYHWFLRGGREREWWKIAFCTSWRNCRWNYAFVRGETFYILGVFVFHSSGQVVFLFLRLPSEVSEVSKAPILHRWLHGWTSPAVPFPVAAAASAHVWFPPSQ